MPAFNQQQVAYKARNANSVVVLIGDQPVAFAQTVNHTFGYMTEGMYGVGTAKPQEIQQLKNAPTITIDTFALTAAGISIITAGQTLPALLANNSFSVCIVDGITNAAQLTYVGCVCSDFNESIGANRPVTDTITFLAMDVLDPSGVSILNGPNAIQVF